MFRAMRSLGVTLLLASFTVAGSGWLLACQGDDNALPLPDAGSDAKAGDATVGASDSGHDAAGKTADAADALEAASDAASDATSDARSEVDAEAD